MHLIISLDEMMKRRRTSLFDLSEKTGIPESDLSNLIEGDTKGLRFMTLVTLCEALECNPEEILEMRKI